MVGRSHKPSAIPLSPCAPQPLVSISDDSSRVIATLPAGDRVEVLLYGATVVSWKSANGKENLFLSDKARLDGSKAVRGGIPLVFPLFGPPKPDHPATSKLPQHGFARTSRWEFLGNTTSESSTTAVGNEHGDKTNADANSVKLDFGLSDGFIDDAARAAWPYPFGLTYSVTLSEGELQTTLAARNTGTEPWEFQVLFHTYLAVDDILKVNVSGLEEAAYLDKVGPNASSTTPAAGKPLAFSGETDRVYLSNDNDITVAQASTQLYAIKRDGLRDAVVWNPWADKSKAMSDFAPDEAWTRMVCVEAGAVGSWLRLEGGDTWEGGQRIRAYP